MCAFSKPDKPEAPPPVYAPPPPEAVAEKAVAKKKAKKKASKRNMASLTISRPTSNIQSTGTGLSI